MFLYSYLLNKSIICYIEKKEILCEFKMFKTKIEAYLFTICELQNINKSHKSDVIKKIVNEIKVFVENHEQDINKLTDILNKLQNNKEVNLNENESQFIEKLLNALNESTFELTEKERFENPLGRRFESEIQIELLENPTSAMLASVHNVSKRIIKVIRQLEKKGKTEELDILEFSCKAGSHAISLGGFKNRPSLEMIKKILRENDKKHLPEIMHIHFKFAQTILRTIEIENCRVREPVGELDNIIKNYTTSDGNKPYAGQPAQFFKQLDREKVSHLP